MGGLSAEGEESEEDVPLSLSQADLKLLPYTTLPAAALVARVRCCRLWIRCVCVGKV